MLYKGLGVYIHKHRLKDFWSEPNRKQDMKLHNLEPLKDCNIKKGRTRKYLPIVTGKRQKVVSPWLVGKWVGGRGVCISLKKQKLSFRIFVVEESSG